ncbi:MAG: Gfo/Idh/MocA family oxidoreductase [Actinomycetota bacterium]
MTATRVAVVGLGDIAEKAYLPVIASRTDLSVILVTRNAATLRRVGSQYRLPDQYTDLDAAISSGLDAAFVHTSTDSHIAVVSRLLTAGIPVFVDKPLAYRYDDAARLVELSRVSGAPLMVGFNRRYAPAYVEIAGWPRRDLVILQRNKNGPLEDPRRSVYDDFIHNVDTLRFLGARAGSASVAGKVVDGLLHHVSVSLSDGVDVAIALMSRVAGMSEECLEVLAPGRKRRVLNIAETIDFEGGEQKHRRDEWRPVGVQRGFSQMCQAFLDGLSTGAWPDIADALATHELCEDIVTRLQVAGG